MLIFTLLLIILNVSNHISETGSVKYILQEPNSCQEKDDFFTCVCNSDGWNKIQLQIHADCCAIKTGKNILWEKKSFITKVQISIGRKIMRRCNQSREKAATSVGPMISQTADERWNLCPLVVDHWFAGKVSRVFWRQLKVPPCKYHHLSNRWFLGKLERNFTF